MDKAAFTFADMRQIPRERVIVERDIPSPHPTHTDEDTVTVRLRQMWSGEYFDLMESTISQPSMDKKERREAEWRGEHMGELMVAFCWVDDTDRRCMEDEDLKSDEWKQTSPAFTTAILDAVRNLNAAQAAVHDGLEDELGNSERAAGEGTA